MKVAIIGGGWAGAAAAHYLCKHQYKPTVFEASRYLGGRARRVDNNAFGHAIDNGQHILLGAYTETLALMQELGIELDEAFLHLDLSIESADTRYRLNAWPLPAPLHLLGALLSSRGFSLKDRYQIIRFKQQLSRQHWQVERHQSVLDLLQQHRHSSALIEHLWQPLCLAALNTPIDIACAQLFANVIRDSLGGARRDTQMLIPKKDMSSLWVENAMNGVELRLGQRVVTLAHTKSHVRVNDEVFDACIVAVPPYAAARLLTTLKPTHSETRRWVNAMDSINYRPIATVYLEPATPWSETKPLLMLHENRAQHEFGQWLFNHQAIPNSFAQSLLSVVTSDATAFSELSKADAITAVETQVRRQTSRRASLPSIVRSDLIIEKRATFEATPFSFRANETTPWPRVF